jgi:D-hydroxyproline dehydrogenase subunit alpha
MTTFDVVVVGAGPAGMAAAATAAKHGCTVCLIDDNSECGGQIWRKAENNAPSSRHFHHLQQCLHSANLEWRSGTRVVSYPAPKILRLEDSTATQDILFKRLILATGARERFLPFPGWTLPGVMGAGGLQAMVKAGMPIVGKRVVIAGSGPLLLAVAAGLARKGARILGIFEQAPLASLTRFGASLIRHPGKVRDGIHYRFSTRSVPYRTGSWVVCADGDERLQRVSVSVHGSVRTLECDYLGCGFHLVPNLELPRLLGCQIESGYVRVTDTQETSIKNVHCVGEPTGIGGLEKALCEGEIAGLTCAGQSAAHLFGARAKHLRFARQLDRAFALRPELDQLATPETFVCRCEDVRHRALAPMHSWREAKLHTRCGMGPCQGRICGPATEYLFGWNASHTRPPILPARVSTFIAPLEDEP